MRKGARKYQRGDCTIAIITDARIRKILNNLIRIKFPSWPSFSFLFEFVTQRKILSDSAVIFSELSRSKLSQYVSA